MEALAETVTDNGGIYFVPAFSGLYAPYWKDNARGVIAGLTRYVNKGHIARAALEATALPDPRGAGRDEQRQRRKTKGIESGWRHDPQRVLMQFQSDLLGVPVVRPTVSETTALGAAYAAGLAVGYWRDVKELRTNWRQRRGLEAADETAQREALYGQWKKAVTRTFDWVEYRQAFARAHSGYTIIASSALEPKNDL